MRERREERKEREKERKARQKQLKCPLTDSWMMIKCGMHIIILWVLERKDAKPFSIICIYSEKIMLNEGNGSLKDKHYMILFT